ncbi:hypothetical protein BJ742DRAFT_787855 [Cladochytrium replicatum]|nr:hypothetical protein BJ742DRAFT_787855 [Cladochytrium replicatum]
MYPAVPRRTERTRHQVNYIQPALSDELIEDEETMQDDDGNGEDEVTRCVCDTTEPSEYMIQCESCEVWQHCECIGITRKNTPKHYYCEECRPINHIVYR